MTLYIDCDMGNPKKSLKELGNKGKESGLEISKTKLISNNEKNTQIRTVKN